MGDNTPNNMFWVDILRCSSGDFQAESNFSEGPGEVYEHPRNTFLIPRGKKCPRRKVRQGFCMTIELMHDHWADLHDHWADLQLQIIKDQTSATYMIAVESTNP